MRRPHVIPSLAVPLAWASCLLAGPLVRAQEQPGLSSGSGAGTGSGYSTGVQRNSSGSMSGSGPAAGGPGGGLSEFQPPRRVPFQSRVPRGPGATVTFPDDPLVAPLLSGDVGGEGDGRLPSRVTPEMLQSAAAISSTYDRARAMLDLGREAILGSQLVLAHRALEQAGTAALAEQDQLRHDQMIIELIVRTAAFTDAIFIEGRNRATLLEDPDAPPQPLPRTRLTPEMAVRLVRLEWQRAAVLARQINNPTFRSEYLERVAENISHDSLRIIEYVHPGSTTELEGEVAAPKLTGEQVKSLEQSADGFLVDASRVADEIERPIWKSFALERIAVNAGQSQQFARAFQVAGTIQNAERRAQTMILLAEEQVMFKREDQATQSYSAAAEAVACIDQAGLRGVVNGFLVDSLISHGRFEDARACLSLYPTESQQLVGLGAIAEGQGARGDAKAAREWIDREAPAYYRDALYRRVNNGMMSAINKNRQNAYLGDSPARGMAPIR